MARSEFALGALLGGLTGLALGYLISRNGSAAGEAPPASTIDLTPVLERRSAADAAAAADPAEAQRWRAEKE